MSHYPHQLSGGQQRASPLRAHWRSSRISCASTSRPRRSTPELTGEVLRVIRSLADQHTTMIIVTHEMAFARDVADHVVFMDGGTIVEEGTPTEVFENTHNERTKAIFEPFFAKQLKNGKLYKNFSALFTITPFTNHNKYVKIVP